MLDINNLLEMEELKNYGKDLDAGIISPEDTGEYEEDLDLEASEEMEAFKCLYL